MSNALLIAGVGNIFFGDDAFGCEVVRRLTDCSRPDRGVRICDYGVRMRDFAYALAALRSDFPESSVLILDAAATGSPPGTLQLFDLGADEAPASEGAFSHHSANLQAALHGARALGGLPTRVHLLGCEPLRLEPAPPVGARGAPLSEPVERAALRCVELLERLVRDPGHDLVQLCMS